MTAITSAHNERLKELRKLHERKGRDQTNRFVAEGEDLLDAAERAGWPALERYVAANSGLAGTAVEPDVLARASTLGSGPRALAVYEQRWAPKPVGPVCVYLHAVADPGNVGTIVRAALAFGVASVALGPACADPYSPKAVRASMGAIFGVPMARVQGIHALPGTTVALQMRSGDPLEHVARDIDGEATLLVGSERTGLPQGIVTHCARVAHIPIHSESLNAAMAATVGLYELTKPRIRAT